MFTLYGIWQWVHERAVTKTAGAIERAHSLYDFEQAIHLPSELSLQNALLHHGAVMRFLNVYYGGAHVPALGLLLVWLFWRHRERYSRIRWTLALSIAGCLAIQTIPVAPPRFLPELGFVDAGLMYPPVGVRRRRQRDLQRTGGDALAARRLGRARRRRRGRREHEPLAVVGGGPPGAHRDRGGRHGQPLVARRRRRLDGPGRGLRRRAGQRRQLPHGPRRMGRCAPATRWRSTPAARSTRSTPSLPGRRPRRCPSSNRAERGGGGLRLVPPTPGGASIALGNRTEGGA